MGTTTVTGNGPLEFTSAKGKQISIPLSAFSFDSNGILQVDAAWATASGLQAGKGLLAYAQTEGLIQPAPAPAPFPAMVIKAADPGAGGNNIQVTITDVSPAADPSLTTFSVVVTETDVYPNLTVTNIITLLGSSTVSGSTLVSATVGSAPGLVQVEAGSVDTEGFPDPISGAVLTGDPASLAVTDSASPGLVFTLLAKKSGVDGTSTVIDVQPNTSSPPVAGNPTFTLTATWTKTLLFASLSDLETLVSNELGYEITVSLPGNGAFSVPAAATSTLSGGTAGRPASATLYTGI